MKLTALIISWNEEENIGSCLDSVSNIADEIIVVDSYSTDKTKAICSNKGVRFVEQEYLGQIEQKNFALKLASYDFILSIDADEVLDETLIREIKNEKTKGFPSNGYSFNRKSYYCGKWINHGLWHPEWKLRIWNKNIGFWGGRNPHDKVILLAGSQIKGLNGKLLHYTFKNYQEHQAQIIKYARISAESNHERGIKFPITRMILSPIFYLIKSYMIKRGFLDSRLGWQIAKLEMKGKFLKYYYQSKIK
jgi:glycosyltransferase involved in cell wall biosynthesis